uniref:Uncharacterized protein n=1 Tax=Oryza sativa subsp. japonica TaxID=39947 RepID=Q69QA8_ORYSJ|nr:hypothetical protein [Oryza sativa Japonica Group]BAD37229.1 hypothetical protein [Oryza sativa Japonica Group]
MPRQANPRRRPPILETATPGRREGSPTKRRQHTEPNLPSEHGIEENVVRCLKRTRNEDLVDSSDGTRIRHTFSHHWRWINRYGYLASYADSNYSSSPSSLSQLSLTCDNGEIKVQRQLMMEDIPVVQNCYLISSGALRDSSATPSLSVDARFVDAWACSL